MDRILSYAAILPRLRANFYMTLPRNAIGLLLGLCMAVAGVMFASGGCTTGGPLFPLAKWLTLFGTLYMLVHLVLIMMGVMMLSYAEHETTNRKHMYDLHMLGRPHPRWCLPAVPTVPKTKKLFIARHQQARCFQNKKCLMVSVIP
jgi:hypothetical protein